MKCLSCMTCGFGPRFLEWLKRRLGWYSWMLRAQIMFTFFFVLGFYYAITLWDVSFISKELFTLTHGIYYRYLDNAYAEIGIRKARESAAQVEALIVIWGWKVNKNKDIINNFLNSSYFVDQAGVFSYPLDSSDTDIKMA